MAKERHRKVVTKDKVRIFFIIQKEKRIEKFYIIIIFVAAFCPVITPNINSSICKTFSFLKSDEIYFYVQCSFIHFDIKYVYFFLLNGTGGEMKYWREINNAQ